MSLDKKNTLENMKHIEFREIFQGGNNGVFFNIKEVLKSTQSEYQRIDIFDTYNLGKVFALDGIVQTVEKFEFMYHEMIAHVPMFSHPNPEKVLIIGGGDGGTLREVLKHKSVKEAVMCEIDEEVTKVAREFLPTLSCGFDDSRTQLVFRDGAEFVSRFEDYFDVIIIDSTDPTAGEGGNLFTVDFYKNCNRALTEKGFLVAQTEDPVFDLTWLEMAFSRINQAFGTTKLYSGFSPQYPSGFWTYTIGSKDIDPEKNFRNNESIEGLKYYSAGIHAASFELPVFLKEIIKAL